MEETLDEKAERIANDVTFLMGEGWTLTPPGAEPIEGMMIEVPNRSYNSGVEIKPKFTASGDFQSGVKVWLAGEGFENEVLAKNFLTMAAKHCANEVTKKIKDLRNVV